MSPAAVIRVAEDLTLPAATAATQVYAFMGRRGSGKSYSASRNVEEFLDHDEQVVIIDPTGVWWGLRFAKDGKTPSGYQIPVFGGTHADLPLPASAGKLIAELAATTSTSMVLDVSEMTGGEYRQFVGDFCRELLHAKKRSRSAIHVVFEEAQEAVPQKVYGEAAKMVGAVERLIKLGRNFGVGVTLISQRPQAVNKDVLNQTEVMFAFQLTGPQERKAIAGWVQETGAGDRDVADDLPSLPIGTAMIWSPQWLRHFGRHKILPKKTYDASATPGGRQKEATRKLPPIDLEAVRAALKMTEEDLAANDVDALRAEVRKLKAALAKAERAAAELSDPRLHKVTALLVALEKTSARLGEDFVSLLEQLDRHRGNAAELASNIAATRELAEGREPKRREPIDVGKALPVLRKSFDRAYGKMQRQPHPLLSHWLTPVSNGEWRPGVAARKVLEVLAASMTGELTWRQVATLAGFKPTGGHFKNVKSQLRTHGAIEETGELVRITDSGRAYAPDAKPTRGQDLFEFWHQRLGDSAGGLLRMIIDEGPIPREDLADRYGAARGLPFSPTGGHFKNMLSKLRTNGLIVEGPNGLTANEAFR